MPWSVRYEAISPNTRDACTTLQPMAPTSCEKGGQRASVCLSLSHSLSGVSLRRRLSLSHAISPNTRDACTTLQPMAPTSCEKGGQRASVCLCLSHSLSGVSLRRRLSLSHAISPNTRDARPPCNQWLQRHAREREREREREDDSTTLLHAITSPQRYGRHGVYGVGVREAVT